jgi:hypothetical protein
VRVLGDGAGLARVTVSSAGGDLFPVETTENPDGAAGKFWLRVPGDYRVRAETAAGSVERGFHVGEQAFLSFGTEFGLFFAALLIAGGGLILWFRNRKRVGAISPSSPCS